MAQVYWTKQTKKMLVRTSPVQAELEKEAQQIRAKAEGNLAPHRKTGAAEVNVEKGHVDRYVNLDDPDAAWAIEFGHEHNFTGEWVQGLYILTRASGLA